MRRFRAVIAITAVTMALAACGGGAGAPRAATDAEPQGGHTHDHTGMTAAQERCMDHAYLEAHHDLCVAGPGAMTPTPVAAPLAVRADGLIDPERVDLSGTAGVTPGQQRRAEELLTATIETIPRWSDIEMAKADGFRSISRDLADGDEHLVHWDWIEDSTILDPEHPESLVYHVDPATGRRTLEAAMYILPSTYTFGHEPPIASDLVQFHVHDDLCFTPAPDSQMREFADAHGDCPSVGGVQLVKFPASEMVHVWIVPNECGPFAALQSVLAGRTASGARACDHDHGKLSL